jgi:hypothetical protein
MVVMVGALLLTAFCGIVTIIAYWIIYTIIRG